MTLGTQARIAEDLRDRVFGRRRLFEFVGAPQRLDVIHRVVVRDVLQGVGDAVDEVLLLDDGH